jgi:hypothetical protein
MPSKIETLAIDLIIADPDVQPREALNPEVVEDYRAAYEANEDMPIALVFREGQKHWLSCGFHRLAGAKAANRASFPCEVRQGTKWDATLAAMNDPVHGNRKHGTRFTIKDKRKMVNTLLSNPEWAQKSMRQIADQAGVAVSFVKTVKDERVKKQSPQKISSQPDAPQEVPQLFSENNSNSETSDVSPESPPETDKVVGTDGRMYRARKPKGSKKKGSKPKKGLTVGQSDGTFDAKQQIKLWADTVGRWLRDKPNIDEFREKWPSKEGDRVVKAATELFEALKVWVKAVK